MSGKRSEKEHRRMGRRKRGGESVGVSRWREGGTWGEFGAVERVMEWEEVKRRGESDGGGWEEKRRGR